MVGADPDADPPWMATAYIAGPSLADAIAEGGPLGEARVRELGAALAEGLTAIHDCGLIHRDLKPGNVILAHDGPRIIDFGIAKGADATALTGSHAVIGTLRYMSPEQLHGQELTPRSDVFALGAILACAATGHDPFQGPAMPAVITRILTGPPDLDPLTGDLRGIIEGCLAKDPGGRPSPGDLLVRFSDRGTHDPTVTATPMPARAAAREPSTENTVTASPALPGRTDPPAARAIAPPEPPRRRSQRRTSLIAVGAAAVAGLAAAGIFTLANRPAPSRPAAATPPVTSSATGKITAALIPPSSPGHNFVFSLAFGPDGILAISDADTYLWNTATGKITATLPTPTSNRGLNFVVSVAFGPDGILATGDGNGSTYLWHVT